MIKCVASPIPIYVKICIIWAKMIHLWFAFQWVPFRYSIFFSSDLKIYQNISSLNYHQLLIQIQLWCKRFCFEKGSGRHVLLASIFSISGKLLKFIRCVPGSWQTVRGWVKPKPIANQYTLPILTFSIDLQFGLSPNRHSPPEPTTRLLLRQEIQIRKKSNLENLEFGPKSGKSEQAEPILRWVNVCSGNNYLPPLQLPLQSHPHPLHLHQNLLLLSKTTLNSLHTYFDLGLSYTSNSRRGKLSWPRNSSTWEDNFFGLNCEDAICNTSVEGWHLSWRKNI